MKFPSTWDLVLRAFLSVDPVPRRMWVKPHAIYTLEYQSTWVSLLSRENVPPTQLPVCLMYFSILCVSGHKVDFNNSKILSFCSDPYGLKIHESLFINKY